MKEHSGVAEGFLEGMSSREEAGHLSTPLEWRLLLFCVLGLLFGPQGTQWASQDGMRQLDRVRETEEATTHSTTGLWVSLHSLWPCKGIGEVTGLSPSTGILKGKKYRNKCSAVLASKLRAWMKCEVNGILMHL